MNQILLPPAPQAAGSSYKVDVSRGSSNGRASSERFS